MSDDTQPIPRAIPPELLDAIAAGECVLFAGAGLSARAGLPIWDKFLAELLEFGRKQQVLSPDYGDSLEAALREGDRNSAADGLVTSFPDRKMLQDFLRQSFPETIPLAPAHEWLNQIPFSAIVTSNYDTLLEKAFPHFSASGLFTPKDAEPLLDALSKKRHFVLKLYGSIERPETLIFAPLEYREMLSSNVSFSKFFEGLFFSRSFFFLGLSLEGIQDFLSGFVFRGVSPRKHFALVAVSGSGWKARADLLERRYNIKVIDYPLTRAFEGFDEFAEALSLAARPVPSAEGATPAVSPAKTGLRRVILEDIGSFGRVELDFDKDKNWKVLLGDNGVGKSTVLKAIAAGIIGSDSKSYAGRLVRAGKTKGRITLITEQNPHGYVTEILTKDMTSEAEVISLPSRYLEAEGCLALGFSPMRVVTWTPSAGPQTIVQKGRPTSDDLVPLLSGEYDPRMDRLKQWIVNLDAADKTRQTHTAMGHTDRVTSLAFRADGRTLLSGSIDRTVREWDARTGKELRKIDAHSGGVNAVAYTQNDCTILSGSFDKTMKSWSADSGSLLKKFSGNLSQVLALAASRDGKTLLSGSEGGSVRVWDLASGNEVRRIDTHAGSVWSLALSEDGKMAVAASDDGTLRVYDVGGSLLRTITVPGGAMWAVALSTNGHLIAATEQGFTGIWDLNSGALVHTLGNVSEGVFSVAITADGRTAAAGSENGVLRIWEVSTGRELLRVKAHSEAVWSVAFSPDGRTLATGSDNKSIKIWTVPGSALPQYATIRKLFQMIAQLTDRRDIEFLEVKEDFRVMVKVAEAIEGVPLELLSQGLTSLIGWVGVLCQRLKETAQNPANDPLPTDAYALVLIDEIDAHMHPAWQQVLVKRLGQLFPQVQFIATSHSPLVVGGLDPNEVYRFERTVDGLVQIAQPEVALKGMGAAGLLTSSLFGLRSQLDIDTSEALRKKRHLTARRLREKTAEGRRKLDEEIENLDSQTRFVDSTEFIRDPLYLRFVEAISKVEPDPDEVPDSVVLTPEERVRRAEEAERIIRELKSEGEET